jgi:hypothetical protein
MNNLTVEDKLKPFELDYEDFCCEPNSHLIKKFKDNSILEFSSGKFDDWCVYRTLSTGEKYAPKDPDYFNEFICLAKIYGSKKIYDDFVKIYDKTSSNIDSDVLNLISLLSKEYTKNVIEIEILFTILYAGMVAEENKRDKNGKLFPLRKRVKRLGMYQILIDNSSSDYAANFSRGKKYNYLDSFCKERGF